jgi:uncharacterized membrane protein YeiB
MKIIVLAMIATFLIGVTGFVCLLVFYRGDHVETLAGEIIVGMTSLLGILGALLRVESKLQENTDISQRAATAASTAARTAAVAAVDIKEQVRDLSETVKGAS